ncbi:MAG: HAD family hydrolase [Pseudomonadota bacterium]
MQPGKQGSRIIAMWSGPRNLSTAMMRSFGNRTDCTAMDEPFYAACLKMTGMDHPMRDEIVAAHENNPEKVIAECLASRETPIVYQKHMMHHMAGIRLDWVDQMTNIFLIRHPARVLASYAKKWAEVSVRDTGYKEQRALFDRLAGEGASPIVIDAHDIRAKPEAMLQALCASIGIEFDPAMLSWAPGPRPEDGVWGQHWYDAIWKSTGFEPPEKDAPEELPDRLKPVFDAVVGDYEAMHRMRIRPD